MTEQERMLLHQYADGELSGAELQQAEALLAEREEARAELEAIRSSKAGLRSALTDEPVDTTSLETRIRAALDDEVAALDDAEALADSGLGAAPIPMPAPQPTSSTSSWTVPALLAAGLAAVAMLVFWPGSQDGTDAPVQPPTIEAPAPIRLALAEEVARDVQGLVGGDWQLAIDSADGPEIEAWFEEEGIAFETRVFDLAMMQFGLEGGSRKTLAGHPSAAFAYRGPDGNLVLCQMFPGDESELPDGVTITEKDGITFYSYQVGEISMTFWREGQLLCVLASMLDADQVLGLAQAKAMKV
ncbi:hypothetical protein ABI59_06810 [Acidobacteria bacterium Mor1]|nr:hypothetical protein ABI59_06810 [Acidobacteria bacterium Mor1]